MKQRTDEEIEALVNEVWPELRFVDQTVTVRRDGDAAIIRIAREYGPPGLSFEQIMQVAEFFDTKNVETESEFANGGCETCDYGSEYGFELRVSPGDPFHS